MLTQKTPGTLRRITAPAPGEPRWARPAAAVMMLGTAILYLWNLTINTYGNTFYAAAVRAGSKSWTALLFGSLDSANGITVDKPPAAFWIPGLMAKIFGFSSFTVLFPQAVMGILTVWFLYLTVKRTNGPLAALVAGTTMALTPVAVMMFRFNNPDAMLTLCLTLGAYFTVRAIESGTLVAARTVPAGARRSFWARMRGEDRGNRSGWWMFAAGLVLGLAFLVKMLQGFLTIPALGIAFLIAARSGLPRRVRDAAIAIVGVCLPVLGYAAVFYAWPADQRPYMAGTDGNSFWELVFGYNGLGRIFGSEGNGGGGGGMGGGNAMFGGSTGVLRMFNSGFGSEISWLIPAAVVFLLAGLWFTRRAPRTDLTRAALVVWGGWLVVTAGIFSFMEGTIHPYYVVALAPAVAALVGIGSVQMWRGRAHRPVRWILGAALLATVIWNFALLQSQASDWMPWIRWTLLIGGSLTAVAIVAQADRLHLGGFRKTGTVVALAALVFGGLGSASWGLATATQGHHGSTPTSGPAVAGQDGGMGGAPTGGQGQRGAGAASGAAGKSGASGSGQKGTGATGTGSAPGGTGQNAQAPGSGTAQKGAAQSGSGQQSAQSSAAAPGQSSSSSSSGAASGQSGQGGTQGGGMGGESSNSALTQLLKSSRTKYSAATVGATGAANYMLASDTDVLDIGGWMGSDPYPTLAEFQQMVKDGDISYFIAGGQGSGGAPGGQGTSSSSAIQAWVKAHYQAKTVGGVTVYDLTSSK